MRCGALLDPDGGTTTLLGWGRPLTWKARCASARSSLAGWCRSIASSTSALRVHSQGRDVPSRPLPASPFSFKTWKTHRPELPQPLALAPGSRQRLGLQESSLPPRAWPSPASAGERTAQAPPALSLSPALTRLSSPSALLAQQHPDQRGMTVQQGARGPRGGAWACAVGHGSRVQALSLQSPTVESQVPLGLRAPWPRWLLARMRSPCGGAPCVQG